MPQLTVGQLIEQLKAFDPSFIVHLDVMAADLVGWEGDRVVRTCSGVRVQDGYRAVALDANGFYSTDFTDHTED